MPEISVVMPLFNGEEYLPEAIESILNQTFSDFEFIIVCEDGMEPGCEEIVNRYAEKDSRIKLIHNSKRLGIAASLNVGLKSAKGKYIARMDGDDISGLRRFEIQRLFMENCPEIGALGCFHTVTNSPNWLVDYVSDPELIDSELLFFVPLRHPTIMLRSELVDNCLYDESLMGVEDYDFYYTLSKHTKLSNIKDPELFCYRRTGSNASEVYSERDHKIMKGIEKRIFSERLGLNFSDRQMDILHMLSSDAYKHTSRKHYVEVIKSLEDLLELIEKKNRMLTTYKENCLHQTLVHRWYREKYKLNGFLGNNIPKDVLEVWNNSRYYSPWF